MSPFIGRSLFHAGSEPSQIVYDVLGHQRSADDFAGSISQYYTLRAGGWIDAFLQFMEQFNKDTGVKNPVSDAATSNVSRSRPRSRPIVGVIIIILVAAGIIAYLYYTMPELVRPVWMKSWGGSGTDSGNVVRLDNNGDAVVAGIANTDCETMVDAAVCYSDFILRKYSKDGNEVWEKLWGGRNGGDLKKLIIGDDGSIYIGGSFYREVDFNPDAPEDKHTSNGYDDAFISKYASDGEYLWTRTWGGTSDDDVTGLCFSASGNILVGGRFAQKVDFDPGSSEMVREGDGSDLFISEFTPTGDFVRVLSWGSGFWDELHGMSLDNSGNLYVAGVFTGSGDFDPGQKVATIVSNYNKDAHDGTRDIFVSRFGPDLQYEWTKVIGGEDDDEVGDLITCSDGSFILAGRFHGKVDFDPGPNAVIKESTYLPKYSIYWPCLFVLKLDSNGDYKWVQTLGGNCIPFEDDVAEGLDGGIFLTGRSDGPIDFPGQINLFALRMASSNWLDSSFVCRLSSDGEYTGVSFFKGRRQIYIASTTIDELSNIFATGSFKGGVQLAGNDFVSEGDSDGFLLKMTVNSSGQR